MGLFDSSDTSAQDYLKRAQAALDQATVPAISQETVGNLPLETVQGTVNPAAIQVATQAPSAYNNIALDPATRAAQMAALSQYTDIASGGGLDAESKLALQQAIDAANAQSQGAQGAIMRSAQAEGQGGGDFALNQRAIGTQGASNTAATQGLQTAAMAEANREAALNAMTNIGGGINASDYTQAAQKAAAENAVNAANQGYTNAANTGNVANAIKTGEFNTGTAQGVNTRNTAANQGKVYYNAGLPQQQFNNELAKASGQTALAGTQAGLAQNAANSSNAMTGSLLGTAGTIVGGIYGGPAGAAVGGMAGREIGGGNSTPTGANANKSNYGLAKGGAICYADGGVAHDHAICMKLGSYVPGKAKVEGDSEDNDTVPAMLSPGELVIPRSVPKDGPHMEEFARNAPVPGTGKKVDLTAFTAKYKRSR
jgi:hypothetical protein